MPNTKKPATSTTFSDDEKAAMKERAREAKAEARRGKDAAAGLADVQAKIAAMPGSDRELSQRLHAVITAAAPGLAPRTWYGQPAYYQDGKLICFFQSASKFKTRYLTLGFSDDARLDDGTMWPTSFAVTKLTAADEARIGALVKKAVG